MALNRPPLPPACHLPSPHPPPKVEKSQRIICGTPGMCVCGGGGGFHKMLTFERLGHKCPKLLCAHYAVVCTVVLYVMYIIGWDKKGIL